MVAVDPTDTDKTDKTDTDKTDTDKDTNTNKYFSWLYFQNTGVGSIRPIITYDENDLDNPNRIAAYRKMANDFVVIIICFLIFLVTFIVFGTI